MDVGMSIFFQSPDFLDETGAGSVGMSDAEVYRNDLILAEQAEALGFDSIWSTEHHFGGYQMNPDVLMFLAYMAGHSKRIQLGSMVLVLPWHARPMQIAESVAQLDNLSGGRYTFGIGRGLGRVEFGGVGVPMDESRDRFVESAQLILEALDKGYSEFDGKFYKQEKRYLRPAPLRTFKGRSYASAASPESWEIMAKLGVGILMIPQKPWKTAIDEYANYQEIYRQINNADAPPTKVACCVLVDEDEDRAKEMASHYIGKYYHTCIKHYEFAGKHFADTAGYEYYSRSAELMQKRGDDAAADFYADLQVFGTPDQCVEKIAEIKRKVNCDHFIGFFSYAGLAPDEVDRNAKLFADKVIPRLKAM